MSFYYRSAAVCCQAQPSLLHKHPRVDQHTVSSERSTHQRWHFQGADTQVEKSKCESIHSLRVRTLLTSNPLSTSKSCINLYGYSINSVNSLGYSINSVYSLIIAAYSCSVLYCNVEFSPPVFHRLAEECHWIE